MPAEAQPAILPGPAERRVARAFRIGGEVQGVGFRPFVYHLAHRLHLSGWVANQGGEVCIHAEGTGDQLEQFAVALMAEAPSTARPILYPTTPAALGHAPGFAIRPSLEAPAPPHLPPDQALCAECLQELEGAGGRRRRDPLIGCTTCGPRYSVITALPYDRARTALADFAPCPRCDAEYRDPGDRRFHAQAITCPDCGPQLQWHSGPQAPMQGPAIRGPAALATGIERLRAGEIVAVKGLAGYHLVCLADADATVKRLRARKRRPHQPFAVMLSARLLTRWRAAGRLTPDQVAVLTGPLRPIVLLEPARRLPLSRAIAPGLATVGLMLPSTGLQCLILAALDRPLIVTSANLSGEPVIIDPADAETRLAGVADGFLHHDRRILRQADDPVVRIIHAHARPLRLGRGNAPLELTLPVTCPTPLLAVGAHGKNTVALAWDDRVVISPHNGDLDNRYAHQVFERRIEDLQSLYGVQARAWVCDAHPDYASSRYARGRHARDRGLSLYEVWHHDAHASAVWAETPDDRDWLVFTWDGTGYGPDGGLWGGEALLGRPGRWRRVASLLPFRLPGGERALRAVWQTAQSLSWQAAHPWTRTDQPGFALLHRAWRTGRHAPYTSSVGRLFDAAACLIGITDQVSFEAQAAMQLEACALDSDDGTTPALPLSEDTEGVLRLDWTPLLPMLTDRRLTAAQRARRFHNAMAQALCDQALALRARFGDFTVGLNGGCFQNRLLSEQAVALLEGQGFVARLPQRLPMNDGGLSLGQIIEAVCRDHPSVTTRPSPDAR